METIFEDDIFDDGTEEMLYDMSNEEFVEDEIGAQVTTNIFDSEKRNYVEFYIEKYKYLKTLYEDDTERLPELRENKEEFIDNIITKVSETFNVEIDEEHRSTKMAKTLYNFFVLNYLENLEEFFFNYIQKNKKAIITEIKRTKTKVRDITTIASKSKFQNNNDALIINNISYILFDLIPSIELGPDFIDYILNYDDDITNTNMEKLISKEHITIDNDTYISFLEPFVERHDGYSVVLSNIVVRLYSEIKEHQLNLFMPDDVDHDI